MKKTVFMILLTLAANASMRAQKLTIVRLHGLSYTYALSEVDSLSFSVRDALAGSSVNNILRIHTKAGTMPYPASGVNSVRCVGGVMTIVNNVGLAGTFTLTDVDSMTFVNGSTRTVSVAYHGSGVTVTNPLAALGVTVTTSGADVTVNAVGIGGVLYALSGTSTDGMFKVYSDSAIGLQLNGLTLTNADGPAINIQSHQAVSVVLANLSTNTVADGAAYTAAPNGEDQKAPFFSEGRLTFTGTGAVTVVGKGSDQHGICSDDDIDVQGGTIVIQSASKDGIHTNDGYSQSAGSVSVTSMSDGVDAGDGAVNITGGSLIVTSTKDGRDALKSATTLTIAGGEITLTVGGKSSKGLKAADIELTGGKLTIQTSGGVVLSASGSGYDPSYCTAAKADSIIVLNGSQVVITTAGPAGRGFSSDGRIIVASGNLTVTSSGTGATYTNASGIVDAYHGPCLNADGNILINGGTITLSHSGAGGKGISGDANLTIGTALSSPTLHVTTTGTKIALGGGEYAEAKAVSMDSMITISNGAITISSVDDALKSKTWIEVNGGTITIPKSAEGFEAPNLYFKGGEISITSSDDGLNATKGSDIEGNDGSQLTISGGYLYLNAPTGDGIDGNGNLTISGGTVIVHGPPSQPEVAVDVNGTFLISGGFIVMAQINSNMVEVPVGSSTQRSVLLKSGQPITAGTLIHIEDASGTSVMTFKPARNSSAILFSTSALTSGASYKVYTAGTCTGTLRDGIYTGGTYSGGTLKSTFTSSSTVQTVTF